MFEEINLIHSGIFSGFISLLVFLRFPRHRLWKELNRILGDPSTTSTSNSSWWWLLLKLLLSITRFARRSAL